jgi:hypothetical protein
MGPSPKWHFVSGLPSGNPKIPKVGTPATLRPIKLSANLQLRCNLKQSCIPSWDLFNGMSHATCTQGNQGDSWLLMVRSQIANLTFDPSFGHNLCLKCPNGSCKSTFDIYVPRNFQWYKEIFNQMGFDPCNCSLKIQESIETPTPKMGDSLGSMNVHSLTLSYTPKNMRCDSWASLLAHTLASLCLGREPKARVTTIGGPKNVVVLYCFLGVSMFELQPW